ncbi:Pimeloyl-ACP methyl ester carboxylesterase [Salinihabitans flavidus]|uniref:Pimeloyl-ACP methyl ester carboxylesterase n=1 Tax=Salinihabitans flavidus TaxID=569882 RepID=A0A1H8R7H2_9RHOB|nr:alpha/beta hydrolase [Salinihabitans flavidus]SEO62301.1 Pimeloyl-ACP methyl ester carboxylesterase [Salinihabitans flavidus]
MPNFDTSDGLTLHYSVEGNPQGVPVLCLSGLTRNTSDFSYVTPHLADVRLIKLDYRGRGLSDWAEDYLSYNVPRECRDVLDLMDHLGIERFAVLGTSRGGLNAMTLGAMVKERLLGVAFNDIGPVLETEGLEVILGYLGRNPGWKNYREATAARPGVMAGFANVSAARWREEVEKFYHQTPDGLIINYDPRLRDAVIEAGTHDAPDLWPYYEALADLPVAVIRGGNSDLLSEETFGEMGRRIPNAILATVPDRGHIPFLDEPEAVAALREWVDRLKA